MLTESKKMARQHEQETYVCMYVCMYIYIYIYMLLVCVYVCMYVYIYIYICIARGVKFKSFSKFNVLNLYLALAGGDQDRHREDARASVGRPPGVGRPRITQQQ